MDPQGKLALVTGASRGIGAATAIALAEAGAKLLLLARSKEDLDAVAVKIRKGGGEAYAISVDLADHEAIRTTAARIRKVHGVPDILVNSAGLGRWLYTEETTHEEAEMMIRLPYLSTFQMTKEFLPGMLERKSGHIVNVNSPASISPWGGATAYASSRWALRGFSESLKVDLHGTGVGISHCVFGKVLSTYWEANQGAEDRLPGIGRLVPDLTVDRTAGHILKAIRKEKREMTKPFMLGVLRVFVWWMPGVVRWVVRKTSYQRD